jgi:hypothetical protein
MYSLHLRTLFISALLLTPAFAAAAPISAPVMVTHDGQTAGNLAMVHRKNGDIVAVFSSSAEPRGNFVSLFKDGGKTWSSQAYLNSGWDHSALIENTDGQLILISNTMGSYDVSISSDGKLWKSVGALNFMQPNFQIGDLMQAQDGTYWFTYSSFTNSNPYELAGSLVYVTKSKDLKGWSKPVRVSGGPHNYSSSILQKKDGSFVVAFNSYDQAGIYTSTSKNGSKWTRPARAVRFSQDTGIRLRLRWLNGSPTLTYGDDFNVYSMKPNGSRWTKPSLLRSNANFETAVLDLGGGMLGIGYLAGPEGPRDVYFDTLQSVR